MNTTPRVTGLRHSPLAAIMLLVVVFGCGFALMTLEILGGRLLNPDFGGTIYVWGSVISIFLLALSLGYCVGGCLSTWRPDARFLAAVIVLAAGAFALIPLVHKRVNEHVFNLDLDDRWGALLSATLLFLVPSLLLGIVSPFSVRLAARDITRVGASAGTLYAIGTLGSFLGCILTSFYFIAWWTVSYILWSMAALLAAVAVICWLIPRTGEP